MKKIKEIFTKIVSSKITTIIASVIVFTPILIFGFIIISSSMKTGEPIIGDRFKGDHDPKITQANLDAVLEAVSNEKITKKEIYLKVSTVRIYLEVNVGTTVEEMQALADAAYNQTATILPIETYFLLQADGKKQYDLEIHVYNNVEDRSSDEFIYYQYIKSSAMEAPAGQLVSQAKDPEFTQKVLEIYEALKQQQEQPAGEE